MQTFRSRQIRIGGPSAPAPGLTGHGVDPSCARRRQPRGGRRGGGCGVAGGLQGAAEGIFRGLALLAGEAGGDDGRLRVRRLTGHGVEVARGGGRGRRGLWRRLRRGAWRGWFGGPGRRWHGGGCFDAGPRGRFLTGHGVEPTRGFRGQRRRHGLDPRQPGARLVAADLLQLAAEGEHEADGGEPDGAVAAGERRRLAGGIRQAEGFDAGEQGGDVEAGEDGLGGVGRAEGGEDDLDGGEGKWAWVMPGGTGTAPRMLGRSDLVEGFVGGAGVGHGFLLLEMGAG